MTPRPLAIRPDAARVEPHPLRGADGTELALTRISRGDDARAAVLLVHGMTASSDMFVVPEIRNLVDVLLDNGYEAWLVDWRGSCRLSYNESRDTAYTFDEVALHDLPAAVAAIRAQIGARPLFAVAHCIGALALSMSLASGLVSGLAGVVAQGVFLTPKMALGTRLLMGLAEVGRRRGSILPVDFRRVGLWSPYTPLFAVAALQAEWSTRRAGGPKCSDPTCQMLTHNGWGLGVSLFVHDHLHPRTHDRLTELVGSSPSFILSHLRKVELAHAPVSWHEGDERYRALVANALDDAHRIDCPILLVRGSENRLWLDSNQLCAELLARRHPSLDVSYVEVPGYGHFDAFIGRGAAIDVFPHITRWLDRWLDKTLAAANSRA